MEVWLGTNTSFRYFIIFVTRHNHAPREKMLKLENKAIKCIFISDGISVKGYNL